MLLALVVLAAAFLGGALVERWQHQSSSASSSLASLVAQFRAARRRGGPADPVRRARSGAAARRRSFGGGGGATIGTVKLVDGTNVYVQDTHGDVIKVTTSPSTQVTDQQAGKVSELEPGLDRHRAGQASTRRHVDGGDEHLAEHGLRGGGGGAAAAGSGG